MKKLIISGLVTIGLVGSACAGSLNKELKEVVTSSYTVGYISQDTEKCNQLEQKAVELALKKHLAMKLAIASGSLVKNACLLGVEDSLTHQNRLPIIYAIIDAQVKN